MDVDEDLDTHICLKCQKTIIGLDNYVAHKRTECPNLGIKSACQNKPDDSIKEPTDSSSQVNVPTLITDEPICQLKSDDFFLSLELKSSRSQVVEQKANNSQDDKDPATSEFESQTTEELIDHGVDDDSSLPQKDIRSQQKSDFMGIDGDDDVEFEDDDVDDDLDTYDCPPRGHTGGKWKPGMRPANSASWISILPDSTDAGAGLNTELAKKRVQKSYSRVATYKCEPCNVAFVRESDLVTHLASSEHWQKSGNHPLNEQLILSHAGALAPLAPFKCSICAFYFNDYRELVKHWIKEDKLHQEKVGQYRKLVCIFCKYRCWTNKEMLEHFSNVAHKQGVSCLNPVEVTVTNELCCSKCNWTCGRQQALFSHMKWKHSAKIHCEKCRINFSSEAALDRHNLTNEHVIKGYSCSMCPYVGESKFSFDTHLVQAHRKTIGKEMATKLDEELKNVDTKHGLEKEEGDKICADTLLKPMPLSVKRAKILKQTSANESDNNDPKITEKLEETAVIELSDLPIPQIHKSLDHTYYEVELYSPGKEEQELVEEIIVKQENLIENPNEHLTKRRRTKVCIHCSQNIADMKRLRIHVLKLHPDKILSCEPCCATFVFKSEFDSHLKGFIHRCNTKDVQDNVEGLLDPVEQFACSQCSFHSTSKSGIMFHEMLHPPKTDEEISALEDADVDVQEEILCVEEDQIENANTMKEEIIVMDTGSDGGSVTSDVVDKLKQKPKRTRCKLLICPICKKGFSAPNLRDHLNVHTGEKPFVCSICHAGFPLKGSLAAHQRSQHAEKRHTCPHCSYRSNRKTKLEEHISTHGVRVRECTCDICGAGFYKSSALQLHMRIHSVDKGRRVLCTYGDCKRAFRTPSEMIYHHRVHTGDKPFLCETCGYAAKSRHQLTKHERSHNGIKPFKCNYCSYSSSRSAQLRRHMRIHSCTRPYLCPHCSYTSSNQENLRKHVLKSKKHAGLSVYPCRHCKFGCNTAVGMRDHTVAEHPAVAKQYDTDAPAFASLVTGIYNQKGDIRAPIDTPKPYVPLTERRDLYKNLHSKLQAKVDSYNLDGEVENRSKQLNDAEDEDDICEDENEALVRIALENHVEKAISEQNEVSTAVEYLMGSTKRKGLPKKTTQKRGKKRCHKEASLTNSTSKNDDAAPENSQLYQLLHQDAPLLHKPEKTEEEDPFNQNQIAIFAIEFPNNEVVEQVVTSDDREETEPHENTASNEQQEYHPNTIILPYNAIDTASNDEGEEQTVTIIEDPEHFHTMTGTNSDGETVILYMPVM